MTAKRTYPDTKTGAIQCLTDMAMSELVRAASQAVQDGTHTWTPDPSVAGVWGLARVGIAARSPLADVIVYCNEADFEVSDDFLERSL